MENKINFQDLFEGFQNTPALWEASSVYNFEQLDIKHTLSKFKQDDEPKKLRLGKWVEKFVTFQLYQDANVKILEENIQIKDNKITIGELDLLLLKDERPIHLEIVYKFYLYDSNKNLTNSLHNWIGPNQNDALVFKLKKLKEKQLPLLYRTETKVALKNHDLEINAFKQKVCFKAQLFLPFQNQNINISPLNQNAVAGWFLNFENIKDLNDFQFYIPEKLEWLCSPKLSAEWLPFKIAKVEIKKAIANKRSPLCWLKDENNSLQKCFITWW